MYEYIVTAFKVVVGVMTSERLAIIAAVALGVMLLWVIFSLIFSFQLKFARGARKINEYISKNGMTRESQEGLDELVGKMSSEFKRGYKGFRDNPGTLPSERIKRFQSLDVELTGGVFNQNKSILKTYTNFVFVSLLLFSVAALSAEEALTGVALAEAAICPLMFLFIAKVIYYVYTAIRQHQYNVAVEEFNDMIDNMDQAAKVDVIKVDKDEQTIVQPANVNSEEIVKVVETCLNAYFEKQDNSKVEQNIERLTKELEEKINKLAERRVAEPSNVQEKKVEPVKTEPVKTEPAKAEPAPKKQERIVILAKKKPVEKVEEKKPAEPEKQEQKPAEVKDASLKVEVNNTPAVEEAPQTKVNEEISDEEINDMTDNFKLDFDDLLGGDDEEEVAPVKRGRGRPRKEVNKPGEFVIKTDKDFEEALSRAEKLMRKNEEPLSPSQTKRVEKQIKELVDAMTKYKEGK